MSQPDEKRQTIIGILDRLRPYAPALGSYVKSIYTYEFDYSVKLSNGLIRLPEELVDDYERAPGTISAERYHQAAARFVPNKPVVPLLAVSEQVHEAPRRRAFSKVWGPVGALIIVIILGMVWYQNHQQELARQAEIQAQQAREQVLADARTNIYHQVIVEGSNYMVNRLFGGIHDLRVTVTNNSDYLVDIVKVKVSYIKADGGLYKEESLYFSQLAPHSVQTLDAPNSDRGTIVHINQESLTCAAIKLN